MRRDVEITYEDYTDDELEELGIEEEIVEEDDDE